MVLVDTGGVATPRYSNSTRNFFPHCRCSPNRRCWACGAPEHRLHEHRGAHLGRYDAHGQLALAVGEVGWSSSSYFPMLVLRSVFGNGDRSLGASPLLSSRLPHILSAQLIHELLDLVHGPVGDLFRLGELGQLGRPGTLHAPRMDADEHRTDCRGYWTTGRTFTPKQIEVAVEAVSVDGIRRVARKYLWDKDVSIFTIFLFLRSATDTLKVCPCWDRSC